jgi:hypothetical protein
MVRTRKKKRRAEGTPIKPDVSTETDQQMNPSVATDDQDAEAPTTVLVNPPKRKKARTPNPPSSTSRSKSRAEKRRRRRADLAVGQKRPSVVEAPHHVSCIGMGDGTNARMCCGAMQTRPSVVEAPHHVSCIGMGDGLVSETLREFTDSKWQPPNIFGQDILVEINAKAKLRLPEGLEVAQSINKVDSENWEMVSVVNLTNAIIELAKGTSIASAQILHISNVHLCTRPWKSARINICEWLVIDDEFGKWLVGECCWIMAWWCWLVDSGSRLVGTLWFNADFGDSKY